MKKKQIVLTFWSVFIIIIVWTVCWKIDKNYGIFTNSTVNEIDSGKDNQNLKIHFIDVGQADSILIQLGNEAMVIDAGNNNDGKKVSKYLKEQGVVNLKYIIGTHPHEDHIGGLDDIIKGYSVDKVFLPNYILPTKTFENLLVELKNKKLKITRPVIGTEYALGDATFTIVLPFNQEYNENVNNYSIGIKLNYGENSFLLLGDAELEAEEDLLASGINIKADVFKLSHHGASTSNSEQLLKMIDPKYVVISVGKDNKYGHPNSYILSQLTQNNIQIYRTDEQGTIVLTSDGKNITFQCEYSKDSEKKSTDTNEESYSNTGEESPSNTNEVSPSSTTEGETFYDNLSVIEPLYITSSGTKYHIEGCQYISKGKISISLEEAINQDYKPCGICNPPK